MKSKQIQQDRGEKTFALVFSPGDEVVAQLLEFAREHRLDASRFTGIGGFSEVTLGYFELDRKDYKHIEVNEQVEVLSLVGNIALKDGDHQPKLHAHVIIGKSDGTAHGGHLLHAKVRPTLEVMLIESPKHLTRYSDPQTGLALLKIK
jgi:predicted DNA-binding protein with PD1-like motif